MTDVKAKFAGEPLLVLLNPENPYVLEINASDYVLKAILNKGVKDSFTR